MSNFARGLVAVPLFLIFAAIAAIAVGLEGIGVVCLLAIGAAVAGYLIRTWWALLIAVPFGLFGLVTVDDAGPLENTDSGFGVVILLLLALPIAIGTAVGVALRKGTNASSSDQGQGHGS